MLDILALLNSVSRMIWDTVIPSALNSRIRSIFSGTSRGLRPNLTPRSFTLTIPSHLWLSPQALAQVGSRPEAFTENFQRRVLCPVPAGAKTSAKTIQVGQTPGDGHSRNAGQNVANSHCSKASSWHVYP